MSRREETIVRIIYFCGRCDYGVFILVIFLGDIIKSAVYSLCDFTNISGKLHDFGIE